MAAAGIAVVALPATNLFLQGRDRQQAMPRGVTAVRALRAPGSTVAAGADNLQDPFNPVGRACPFETAALMVLTAHLQPVDAWNTVSEASARATGFGPATVASGAPADLLAVRAGSLREAIAFGPADRILWRAGERQHGLQQHVGAGRDVVGRRCTRRCCGDSPSTLGVKIIAVGQTRASIWASWPAPLGIRRVE